MANTNGVAFNATTSYNDISNRGPADATEPTALAFNIVTSGGSTPAGSDDDVGTGPGGIWGTSVVG